MSIEGVLEKGFVTTSLDSIIITGSTVDDFSFYYPTTFDTLSYNYTTKVQYVYINGLFLNSTGNNITLTHSSLQIARGGQSGSTQLTYYPYLNCQISQLSIYNRPLSAQEIRQNFNATRKRYGV